MKLKIGDTVTVTAGKDKGKVGKITKTIPKKLRVIVEGANKYKRHLKRQSDQNPGGVVEIERSLPVSNIALQCPNCKKLTRVGYQISKTGEKQRICKKCKTPITIAK